MLRVKLPVVENGLVLSEVEVVETTISGAVDCAVEFALLPAVKNGYIDYYSNNDLFDLTYAG